MSYPLKQDDEQKRIEALSRELENFVYIASHDLQSPLRKVGGFTKRLQEKLEGQLDEQAQTYMSFIIEGVDHMSELIQGLLDYSRLSTEDVHFQDVKTGEVIEFVKKKLENEIEESGTQIHYETLPSVYYDKSMLAMLFKNLISNAIKYHGDTPPEINITARKLDDFWEFSVEDKGIGIDKENHELIFKMFKRLHRKEDIPGTGIGLPLCRKIVEQYGGRIFLASEPGKGSAFKFTIPVKNLSEKTQNV